MKLGFYGAAGEVTGSNFILETGKYRVLVDCGLFQGARMAEKHNYQPLAYNPQDIDVIILTHAHLDHCGRLPLLWKLGYRGKIYSTPASCDLAELIMTDAAGIMQEEAQEDGHEPLYLTSHVVGAVSGFSPVEYGQKIEVLPGVMVEFYEAGHILGSASVVVSAEGKRIVFSGDLGNDPVPILRPSETPPLADVVIMETTYGNRLHDSPSGRRAKLRAVLRQAAARQGTLLIPAFAIERTQEILYELNQLTKEESLPAMPVFLDSPLAIAVTDVYYRYPRYFDEEAKLLRQQDPDANIFQFPLLKITATASQSKAIKAFPDPKVIIAGSGMMEGGRMIHHAANFLSLSSTTLLFVGYQANGTLGRELYDNKRKVKIKGRFVTVKSHVAAISAYSSHADRDGLTRWLDRFGQKPGKVFLVHGERQSSLDFASHLGERYNAYVPTENEVVDI